MTKIHNSKLYEYRKCFDFTIFNRYEELLNRGLLFSFLWNMNFKIFKCIWSCSLNHTKSNKYLALEEPNENG